MALDENGWMIDKYILKKMRIIKTENVMKISISTREERTI